MKTLFSARQTVDLCIFCITSPEMSDALVDLHRHGVIVRVIADEGQLDSEGSKVGCFRAEGKTTLTATFLCKMPSHGRIYGKKLFFFSPMYFVAL